MNDLRFGDPGVREAATRALSGGSPLDQGTQIGLMTCLKHGEPAIREAATRVLGRW